MSRASFPSDANKPKMEKITFVAILMVCGVLPAALCKDLSNGWHDSIDWKKLDDAMAESAETNKPVMVIIHKSWCGACNALKPRFSESEEIGELSKDFLMVNLMDDDEPDNPMFAPDGGYIPRILFIHEGKVRQDLYHKNGNAKYKFYYHSPVGITQTMRDAADIFNVQPTHADEL